MKVGDRHYRTIWVNENGRSVDIIDQRWLPHAFRVETVGTVEGIATAIRDMWVRGAPLIGVTMPSTVPTVSTRKACGSQRWSMMSTERPSAFGQMVR